MSASSEPRDRDRELYERALRELAELNAKVIAAELPRRLTEVIAERDLVPRPLHGEPTARELMLAVYDRLERAVHGPSAGTYVGGAKILKDVAEELGVPGAGTLPTLRRTRAQVEAAPNPERRSEGALAPRAGSAWPAVETLPEGRRRAKRAKERRQQERQQRPDGIPTRSEAG